MSTNNPHRLSLRVYYEDTDFSGNVYHAAYLHVFERGRTEFLRDIGVHHSELVKDGIAFAVRSMSIDFAAAAHLSCLDYISDVDWHRSEIVKEWYAKIKSRPAFRSILADQVPGFRPPSHYADLDF